jgi:hypothetical protein
MSEIIKNKYLDYAGLKKYDELIKILIESGHKELADAIAALDAKIGSLEFEGSDDKSFSEVINEIYGAIAGLDAKDAELEGKIDSIIGDLESLEGFTLAEISAKLSEHAGAIDKHTTDIAGVKERVTALEETVKNLGEIEGGESLGDIVNKVNANAVAIETLKGEGEGSVKKAAADAQAAAVSTAAADATSKAGAAETAAKEYADTLDTAMNKRVADLEAIDHEQLVADAVAAVVAGAESDFDTLKEVADWIAADTTGSAALQATVSGHTESIAALSRDKQDVIADLDTIRSGAAAGATALADAKSEMTTRGLVEGEVLGTAAYADTTAFDAAGTAESAATQALADAKADAAEKYQEKGAHLTANDFAFATDGDIDALLAESDIDA